MKIGPILSKMLAGTVSSTYLGMVVANRPLERPNRNLPTRIVSRRNTIVIPVPTRPKAIFTNYARHLPNIMSLPPINDPKVMPKTSVEPMTP